MSTPTRPDADGAPPAKMPRVALLSEEEKDAINSFLENTGDRETESQNFVSANEGLFRRITDQFEHLNKDELNLAVKLLYRLTSYNPALTLQIAGRKEVIATLTTRLNSASQATEDAVNNDFSLEAVNLLIQLTSASPDLSRQLAGQQEFISTLETLVSRLSHSRSEIDKIGHIGERAICLLGRLIQVDPTLSRHFVRQTERNLLEKTDIISVLATVLYGTSKIDDYGARNRDEEAMVLLNGLINGNPALLQRLAGQPLIFSALETLLTRTRSISHFMEPRIRGNAISLLFQLINYASQNSANILISVRAISLLNRLSNGLLREVANQSQIISTLETLLTHTSKADDLANNAINLTAVSLLIKLIMINPDLLRQVAFNQQIISILETLIIRSSQVGENKERVSAFLMGLINFNPALRQQIAGRMLNVLDLAQADNPENNQVSLNAIVFLMQLANTNPALLQQLASDQRAIRTIEALITRPSQVGEIKEKASTFLMQLINRNPRVAMRMLDLINLAQVDNPENNQVSLNAIGFLIQWANTNFDSLRNLASDQQAFLALETLITRHCRVDDPVNNLINLNGVSLLVGLAKCNPALAGQSAERMVTFLTHTSQADDPVNNPVNGSALFLLTQLTNGMPVVLPQIVLQMLNLLIHSSQINDPENNRVSRNVVSLLKQLTINNNIDLLGRLSERQDIIFILASLLTRSSQIDDPVNNAFSGNALSVLISLTNIRPALLQILAMQEEIVPALATLLTHSSQDDKTKINHLLMGLTRGNDVLLQQIVGRMITLLTLPLQADNPANTAIVKNAIYLLGQLIENNSAFLLQHIVEQTNILPILQTLLTQPYQDDEIKKNASRFLIELTKDNDLLRHIAGQLVNLITNQAADPESVKNAISLLGQLVKHKEDPLLEYLVAQPNFIPYLVETLVANPSQDDVFINIKIETLSLLKYLADAQHDPDFPQTADWQARIIPTLRTLLQNHLSVSDAANDRISKAIFSSLSELARGDDDLAEQIAEQVVKLITIHKLSQIKDPPVNNEIGDNVLDLLWESEGNYDMPRKIAWEFRSLITDNFENNLIIGNAVFLLRKFLEGNSETFSGFYFEEMPEIYPPLTTALARASETDSPANNWISINITAFLSQLLSSPFPIELSSSALDLLRQTVGAAVPVLAASLTQLARSQADDPLNNEANKNKLHLLTQLTNIDPDLPRHLASQEEIVSALETLLAGLSVDSTINEDRIANTNCIVFLSCQLVRANPALAQRLASQDGIISALETLLTRTYELSDNLNNEISKNIVILFGQLTRDNPDLSRRLLEQPQIISTLQTLLTHHSFTGRVIVLIDQLTNSDPSLLPIIVENMGNIIYGSATAPWPISYGITEDPANIKEGIFLLNRLFRYNGLPQQMIAETINFLTIINFLAQASQTRDPESNFNSKEAIFLLNRLCRFPNLSQDIGNQIMKSPIGIIGLLSTSLSLLSQSAEMEDSLFSGEIAFFLGKLQVIIDNPALSPQLAGQSEVISNILISLTRSSQTNDPLHNDICEETIILLSQLTQPHHGLLEQTLQQPNLIVCLTEIAENISNNPNSKPDSKLALLSFVANLASSDDFCESLKANPALINSLKTILDNPADPVMIDLKENSEMRNLELMIFGDVNGSKDWKANPNLPKLIVLLQQERGGLEVSSASQLAGAQARSPQLP